MDFLCNVAHLRAAVVGAEIPAHGECEFCAGGSQHEEMMESARRIASKEIDVESWVGPQQILPILEQFQRSAGCGTVVIELDEDLGVQLNESERTNPVSRRSRNTSRHE